MEEIEKIERKIQEIKRLRDLLIDETSEDFFQKITGDLKEVIIKNNLCRSPAVVEDLFQFVLKVLFLATIWICQTIQHLNKTNFLLFHCGISENDC